MEGAGCEGFVVTGVMASGKSTVSEGIAASLPRAAHVRGDVFRRMIVSGRDPMAPPLGLEALRQLQLRRTLATSVANAFWRDGFSVVIQDIYPGDALIGVVDALEASPLHVVVLAPRADVVRAREDARGKVGYRDGWDVDEMVASFARETPRIGLWLDTSDQSPAETVGEILERRAEARVR